MINTLSNGLDLIPVVSILETLQIILLIDELQLTELELEQTHTNTLILRNTPLYQSPKRSPTNLLHSSLTSQQQSNKAYLPYLLAMVHLTIIP